jgi:hypothetical protein
MGVVYFRLRERGVFGRCVALMWRAIGRGCANRRPHLGQRSRLARALVVAGTGCAYGSSGSSAGKLAG